MGLTDQVEQKLEMGCAILKMFTSSLAFGGDIPDDASS